MARTRSVTSVLSLLLVTLMVAAAACAQERGLDADAQAVGERLFAKGSRFDHERALELFAEGFRFDGYARRDSPPAKERLTRLRIHRSVAGQSIDLLLKGSGDNVTSAELCRPLGHGREKLGSLVPLFEPLRPLATKDYAGPLAKLFTALTHLDRVTANRLPMPLETQREAARSRNDGGSTLTVGQPRPVLGAPCPDFRGQELTGRRFSRFDCEGRPLLVFLGSMQDAMCREMRSHLYGLLESSPIEARFVEVLENERQHLVDYMRQGGRFRATVLTDPRGENRQRFKVPFLPYVLGYDGKHELRMFTGYKGRAALHKALTTYGELLTGRGGNDDH